MTPKTFAALAIAAVVTSVAAIAVYSSSVEWSTATPSGEPLFANLPPQVEEVEEIQVEQEGETIALRRDGEGWVLQQHESFPASTKRVDALLAGLSKAKLVEAKTRKQDRYALLGVEDPASENAKSRLVRLIDGQGDEIAAAIIGQKRVDQSGLGNSGTYVRRPGDAQAWLADVSIDAGATFEDWVNAQLFEASRNDVKQLTVYLPGEEPLEIERAEDRPGHTLATMPDGKKLRYVNIVDEIVRAASTVEFSDVRKAQAPTDTPAKVVMELEGELTATFHIKQEDGVAWLALEASGEGESEKIADALMARAEGWEFRVPLSRVNEILKRKEELLEDVSS